MCSAPVVGDADAVLKLKAGVIASSTLAAATVLWLRQTPMATLRVESFGAARRTGCVRKRADVRVLHRPRAFSNRRRRPGRDAHRHAHRRLVVLRD